VNEPQVAQPQRKQRGAPYQRKRGLAHVNQNCGGKIGHVSNHGGRLKRFNEINSTRKRRKRLPTVDFIEPQTILKSYINHF